MEQTLINLVLALTASALLHNVVEMLDKHERVKHLNAHLNENHDMSAMMSEETPRRAYVVSIFIFVVLVSFFYGFFSLLKLENTAALITIITLLIVTYLSSVLLSHTLRLEIDRLFPESKTKD